MQCGMVFAEWIGDARDLLTKAMAQFRPGPGKLAHLHLRGERGEGRMRVAV